MSNKSIKYPFAYNNEEFLRLEKQAIQLRENKLAKVVRPVKNCLEIGCGPGANLKTVFLSNQSIHYHGIDVNNEAIKFAKTHAQRIGIKATFHTGNAKKLPHSDAFFDLVFIRLVLWSTGKDWKKIIAESLRVLKPGGYLYCFEPDDSFLFFLPPKKELEYIIGKWQKKQKASGLNPFIGRDLYTCLIEAGFKHVQISLFTKMSSGATPKKYREHAENLKQIFLGRGPHFLGFQSENILWNKALHQINNFTKSDLISESHFVAIGQKSKK